MAKSSWAIGAEAEKRVLALLEQGEYDGEKYVCHRFPKQRFAKQDLWGADIICVSPNHWLLCQVKYQSKRIPPMNKHIKDDLLEVPMPDNTKHVVARIDGRDQKIYWDEL